MSHMLVQSFRFQMTPSSSNAKQLSCGGEQCKKCGACRDWYQRRNSDDIIKRYNATCTCDYMFRHNLVRHPVRCDNGYYPIHSLICMCKENGWK
ncbi:unnamed protein product [Adineta steineri]|uniref:Uncharacterized protein n=1 Tax=Adineta steineri TaxID=433720 RepID=A0A814CWN6_9BILA|nr:unnamed protein product [Adineta steineri]CAF3861896.1 unnamed protein product [Adineta steineri]